MDPSQEDSRVGASNEVIGDGFVRIESVATTNGQCILLPMRLDFPEGQIYAILGPSGSGKTTFLNTIADNIQSNIRACGEGKSLLSTTNLR
jgi:ABC-type multidrug transport system ATPase subunit